jgi:predicted nucleic acid-binding protein
MAIVVDTSVLIDHLRWNQEAHASLRGAVATGERLVASVLTKVEVLAGMRASEEQATRRLLDSLGWIDVDDDLAEHAGALARRLLPTHPGVDAVDDVIAATGPQLGAELWTRSMALPDVPRPAGPVLTSTLQGDRRWVHGIGAEAR